jgi:predicted enzyme related to lactoylglutathione lyase
MGRVVHFEITADDMDRAEKFYRETFGWDIHKWDAPTDYRLMATGHEDSEDEGIDGAIMPRAHGQAVINTIDVDDLPAMIEKVKAAGGSLVNEPQNIPGTGDFVYIKDTEGNVFGLMQAE